MLNNVKYFLGLGPTQNASQIAAKKDANKKQLDHSNPSSSESTAAVNGGSTTTTSGGSAGASSNGNTNSAAVVHYSRLLKVGAVVFFSLGAVCYATNAHLAVVSLSEVVGASPRGSLTTPKGIIALCGTIQKVAAGNLLAVTVALLTLYLTLQTFCIPGTIALNAMMGALLGVKVGLPLCVFAGTLGASCCYTLSSVAGARFAEAVDGKLLQGRGIPKLRAQVMRYRAELFSYLLFLRLTPILPNWLINLASPVVHVPLRSFALATLVGITPQTYLSVRFGTIVNAESVSSIVTPYDTIAIAALGLLVLFIGRLKKKFGGQPSGAPPVVVQKDQSTPAAAVSAAANTVGGARLGGSPTSSLQQPLNGGSGGELRAPSQAKKTKKNIEI